jgi:predicted dehydrogenase
MSVLKVGIIGAGIGKSHATGFRGCKDVEIAAMAELNEERARKVMQDFGIRNYYKDYKEMLRAEGLDAVSVGIPNFLHKQVVIDCLNAGANVLCEKPMAMNAGEAEEMALTAKRKKKLLMIGFTNRFSAEAKLLRSIVKGGGLGDVYHGRAFCVRRRGIPGLGGWFTTKKMSGGGGIIDIGVHIIDLTLWQMGFPKPVAVSGQTYMKFGHKMDYNFVSMWGGLVKRGGFDVDDYASALIRLEGGKSISADVAWACNAGEEGFKTTILGDKGGALLEPWGKPGLTIYKEEFGKIVDVVPKVAEENGWVNEFNNFCDSIRGLAKPCSPAEHGVTVQKILDAIYLSSKLNKEVKIR